LITLVLFIIIVDVGKSWPLYVILGSLGFFIAPCLTVGIELSCEIGYPVGEAYSNGMIQIFGNILGIGFMLISSFLLDG
jgi:hypothetical protein